LFLWHRFVLVAPAFLPVLLSEGETMPPIQSFTKTRRNLPHWQQPGSIYALTWRVVAGRALEPEDRTLALNAIRHWDGKRWNVLVAVVMQDHVHALVRPIVATPTPEAQATHALGDILHGVKGYSAYTINRRQGRTGALWQDERYDRIVRDERELEDTWNYFRLNPVRAGLVESPEAYTWLYEVSGIDG
jgi:REP element-mobilizing transposase RayT